MGNTVSRITNTGNYLVNGSFDEWTGAPVVDNSLFLWYDAGQSAGYNSANTTMIDLSNNGTGLLANGATYSSTNGGAILFNYNTETIIPTLVSSKDQTNFITISSWVNSSNITQSQNIVSRNGPYFLRIVGSKLRCDIYAGPSGSPTWLFQGGNATLQSNTWYNLSMTYDGANLIGYINGVQDFIVAKTGIFGSYWTLYIGYTRDGGEQSPFNGLISQVQLYNRALSAAEIQKNYNALAPRYGLTQIANVSSQIRTTPSTILASGLDETTFNIVEALIVAGGGSGEVRDGGGGGAGGLIYTSSFPIKLNTSYTVTVGQGGPAANGTISGAGYLPGTQGSPSVFGTLTATGGGGGAISGIQGGAGGSGGGDGGGTLNLGGGPNVIGQGNRGGQNTLGSGAPWTGGGGGGAGSSGGNVTVNEYGGVGGAGLYFSQFTSVGGSPSGWFAGGGGGGGQNGGGTGGIGGGGTMSPSIAAATSGTPNTGGGGGANRQSTGTSGAGGSGIIVVRYPSPQIATGGTVTTSNGYILHTFTSNGTFTTSNFPAKRELTTGTVQVAGNFDEWTGAPVADSSLVLWLDAGQPASYNGSGTIWTDLSGKGNNGTLYNISYNSSLVGGSVLFNGSNSYVNCGTFVTAVNIQTISVWVKFNDLVNAQEIVSKSAGSTGVELLLYSNALQTYVMGAGTPTQTNIGYSVSNLNTSSWYNIVATQAGNGGAMNLYVNGTVIASGTAPTTINDSTNLLIGTWNGGGRFFNGSISQIQIYNRALSAQEIQQNFNALRGRYGI